MQACEASQQADYESTDDIAYPLETEMLAMARAVEEGEVSTVWYGCVYVYMSMYVCTCVCMCMWDCMCVYVYVRERESAIR